MILNTTQLRELADLAKEAAKKAVNVIHEYQNETVEIQQKDGILQFQYQQINN